MYRELKNPVSPYVNKYGTDSEIEEVSNLSNTSSILKYRCLWKVYPHYGYDFDLEHPEPYSPEEVYKLAGENIYKGFQNGDYYNSCALRLSIAIVNCIGNIPPSSFTNRNLKTGKRYILSSYYMHVYIMRILGSRHGEIVSFDSVGKLKGELKDNQLAIACNSFHTAIIKSDYVDNHTPSGNMDYWILV